MSEIQHPSSPAETKSPGPASLMEARPPQTNGPLLLEAREVTKSFWLKDKRIDVLKNMTFSLEQSQTIAIVGASGAGKSTLLQILGTLDLPTSGSIQILGRETQKMDEDELATFRNQTMGFVFQAHYLLPEFTALENIMMPAFIRSMPRREAKERANELLNWVGLQHRSGHRPGEMSGGEKQRVALCRALVMQPPLLFADEPTGNLDFKTSNEIHKLLLDLSHKWGVTPIVVTHNLSLAQKMDRILEIKSGSVQYIKDISELQNAAEEASPNPTSKPAGGNSIL